jgi:DNA polymerase-3 subunit alpha
MRIAADMGGFTLGQADLLRRAMGQKNPEEMEGMRGRFLEGARARGVPAGAAEAVFDQMAKFAGYGFNKSHSAAYAMLAFQTAYLKAHHGPEFMAALLTSETGDQDRIAQYAYECRRMGVPLLPPDINESSDIFTVTPAGQVRFSLLALRNVGGPAVKALLEAREAGGPFPDLFTFCRRVDMRAFNPRMIASLVQAGAFDPTGARRSQMLEAAESAVRQALGVQNDAARGQTSLFDARPGRDAAPAFNPLPEAPPSDLLRWEKEALGFYLSGHPLSAHEDELEHYALPLAQAAERPEGVPLRVAGLVGAVHPGRTKRNEDYVRFRLEDLHTHLEVVAWPEVYRQARNLLATDRLVAVLGVMDHSGNAPQMVAQEVIALEEMAVKWAKAVVLTVNLVGMEERLLEGLRELCARHPGGAHVTFRLQSVHLGEVLVQAGEDRKVRPSKEFLEEVALLLGEDAVKIEV